MKAVIIREFGGPEVLRFEEVPTPAPGPGEVLLRVHAVSVNRSLDLRVRQNLGGYNPVLPLVLGVDPSGIVTAVGDRVEQPCVNDRVVVLGGVPCGTCSACLAQLPQHCRQRLGIQRWGGYAEYVVVPAHHTVPIPDQVSFAEATVVTRHFPMAFTEVAKANLQPGEWTLIMGAAGALGSSLVQVTKQLGGRVIAAAGADDRVAAALSLGADFGINYRQQNLEQEVLRITDGHGVDVVFENIGDPDLWPGAFNSLARHGRLVTAGAHGGGLVTLDIRRLYGLGLQVIGTTGGQRLEDMSRSLELAAAGKLRVLIDRIMPLRAAAEAHRLVEDNKVVGKVILDPTL